VTHEAAPNLSSERPATALDRTAAPDRAQREAILSGSRALDADDARLASRARHQALWLMALSCFVTAAIVAGVWLLLR
jgi:hypothetical protein